MCSKCVDYSTLNPLNIVFRLTYYLELHNTICIFTSNVILYQVKIFMLYNIRTTNSTFIGQKKMRYIITSCILPNRKRH
jgi:hypothetical protein